VRRLTLEPTHPDKQSAKHGDIDKIATEFRAGWKQRRAGEYQDNESG
jgi:hypothetical protein